MVMVPGFFSVLMLATSKAVVRVATAVKHRRQARELATWDARALRDIGLSHGDVSGALSLPLHRDPTEYLARIASGRTPISHRDAVSTGTSRPLTAGKDRLGILPSAEPAPCA